MAIQPQPVRPQRRDYIILTLLLCVFFLLGLLVLEAYQYQINPDGVAYISIAQKYLRGEFAQAINGYWSPLLSWMLVPGIALGVPPLLAAKIAGLFIGLFILIITWYFSFQFSMLPLVRVTILSLLPLLILYFISSVITPDLLLTVLLLLYFLIFFGRNYSQQAWKGALCGFLGALAYLTKAYALPFFMIHFTVLHLLRFRQEPESQRGLLRNFVLGMFVFGLLSGTWTLLLSDKYGYFTTGTAGKHNFFSIGPAYDAPDKIIFDLAAPPNDTAININEDPALIQLSSWNPLSSRPHFFYFLHNIFTNLREFFFSLVIFSVFVPFVLVLGAIGLFSRRGWFSASRLEQYTVLTILLYPLGYLLIIVEFRYFWPLGILSLLISGSLFSRILGKPNHFLSRRQKALVMAAFVFSWILLPLVYLWNNRNINRDDYLWAQEMKKFNIHGNLASNYYWHQMLPIAYYLPAHYYGQVPENLGTSDLSTILLDFDIDYYFFWDQESAPVEFGAYEKIQQGNIRNLDIYRRKR